MFLLGFCPRPRDISRSAEGWWARLEANFVISHVIAEQNAINFRNYPFFLNAFSKLKLCKSLAFFPFLFYAYCHSNLLCSCSDTEKCTHAWTVYWQTRLQLPFSVSPWNLIFCMWTATAHQSVQLRIAPGSAQCSASGSKNPSVPWARRTVLDKVAQFSLRPQINIFW